MKPPAHRPAQTRPEDIPPDSISALVDGQATGLEAALNLWRDDPKARADWHAYHLIGDVMRSDDLASSPARDAAFMAGLRQRLAQEPVVLAPAPVVPAAPAAAPAWRVPVAVAAAVVVVSGVLVVARMGSDGSPAGTELAAASAAQARTVVIRPAGNGQALITDPRLDEFLRAHQAAGGSVAAAAPGGTLRRVEVIVPAEAGR